MHPSHNELYFTLFGHWQGDRSGNSQCATQLAKYARLAAQKGCASYARGLATPFCACPQCISRYCSGMYRSFLSERWYVHTSAGHLDEEMAVFTSRCLEKRRKQEIHPHWQLMGSQRRKWNWHLCKNELEEYTFFIGIKRKVENFDYNVLSNKVAIFSRATGAFKNYIITQNRLSINEI